MERGELRVVKILYVANLIPYPLDNGGKIFTFSTIQALSKNNAIDLLCFYEHEDINAGIAKLKDFCCSVDVLPIKVTTRENMPLMMVKALKSLFSSKPLGISKYYTPEMKVLIEKKMQEKKYDCVFFNLLAMYGYCDYIKEIDPQIKAVLYEQNCEALIYRRLLEQTKNPLKRIFVSIETKKLTKFEDEAVYSVDELFLLSKEDQVALGLEHRKCNIIPIGVNPPTRQKKYTNASKNKITLLFVGTMTWAPNNEGVIWFLQNVMPLCTDENKYELFIIGKNPSETVTRLSRNFKNVHLLGYVESLDEYYDKSDVLIVPLFVGGGQRVKIIEAFGRGFAVISTSIGVEGLKYEDEKTIMIADDASAFKEKIDSCFSSEKIRTIGSGGKEIFDMEYSTVIIEKKINDVLSKMFLTDRGNGEENKLC